MPKQCLNAGISDVEAFACPSHGWESVQDFIYTTLNGLNTEYWSLAGGLGEPQWVEIAGRGSHRRLLITTGFSEPEGFDRYPVKATTQQTAVADALTEVGELWTSAVSNVSTRGHGSVLNRQDAAHTINYSYYQPYTQSSCALDYIHGPLDDGPVAFPISYGVQTNPNLDKADYVSILGVESFVYPNLTKKQLLNTPGSPEQSRLKWVELPQDPFNGSAIGAIILLPRSIANMTQEIILCNVGAGWGSSHINTSSSAGGTTFTTSIIDPSAIVPVSASNSSEIQSDVASEAEAIAIDNVVDYWRPLFPEKPIIVTEAWATYLNPFISSLNTTVIDALMTIPVSTNLSSQWKVDTAKWVLAGLLINGLASIGATSELQGKVKTIKATDNSIQLDGNYWFAGKGDMFIVDPEESKDWVKLRVDSTIAGYAYNIRGTSPKVAITFLLIYCVIALSHVLYAGISGKRVFYPSLLVHTDQLRRYVVHMLGLHRRSDSTSHEFHSHNSLEEYLCRHSGIEYL